MSDLEDLVPPHEPAEDALAFAGKAALSAIPIVGPLAAETLAYALETRQAERQHEFNVEIARALSVTMENLDGAPTIEDIVGSDEFIAGVTRAQRAAAETASELKRRRLAAAVVNGGSWAPFTASEREQFTRLVEEFSEIHVWLLHYFCDPAEWLKARGLYEKHTNTMMGGITHTLESALGRNKDVWMPAVEQAAADLERANLAQIPLRTTMSLQGVMERRTSEKGRRLLSFLNEPDNRAAEPPTSL